MRRLRRTLDELHRDQDGASMVFATITFFTIAISIMFVFQVSLVSTDRIQIQNAADAAAYSGALVEANSLNAIGQVNDTMAFVHYNLLRYTVDSIVYRTLEDFTRHDAWAKNQSLSFTPPFTTRDRKETGKQPPSVPNQTMLGDTSTWKEKLRSVENNEPLIQKGVEWLQDLHHVGRLIVAVTPRLVREAAIDVAQRNGATHVAISRDLELAFRLTGPGAGFKELVEKESGGMGGGSRAAPQSVWRYAVEALAVDSSQPMDYPSWFDPFDGTNSSTYSQARICWDAMDWAHGGDGGGMHLLMDGWLGGNAMQFRGDGAAPNGHWHAQHRHLIYNPETYSLAQAQHATNRGGTNPRTAVERPTMGKPGGGHSDDDTLLHGSPVQDPNYLEYLHLLPMIPQQDHAVIRCPTCYGLTSVDTERLSVLGGPGRFGTVVVNSDMDVSRLTHRPPEDKRRHFSLQLPSMPRPLGITEDLLRSGITVVAYRPGLGIGNLLPASPWGTVAVASAQVGLVEGSAEDGGSVLLLERFSGAANSRQASYASSRTSADGVALDAPEFRLVEEFGGDPARHQDPTFSTGQENYRNLYYHHEFAKGLRFGARLVPVARPYTWHPDLEGGVGLDEMIGQTIDEERWYRVGDAFDPTSEVPEIGALHDFLSVGGPRSLEEAMWH